MVINAIQDYLSGKRSASEAAEAAVLGRRNDPDYTLLQDEEDLLRRRVVQVGAARDALLALLEAAVAATPWVGEFGAEPSFGVGAAADPYVRSCRAECMLAALVLHVEGGAVSFVDEERLEVLRDAPPPEAIGAVRDAVKGPT